MTSFFKKITFTLDKSIKVLKYALERFFNYLVSHEKKSVKNFELW